ncbi:sulfate adenylyltransferase subunit 1 [Thermoanaerobacterium thermosaccharolyticum]|uniref:sulfate adenylyltransferase n=1 Tax=Thermoanaerobacterium thermosaccharolyticum M0795 TaxID=698948 RepID=L0IMJ7_THETR|nr:GTP-binding protein [Thermoanaerobacterium thermosaccharolyticum]AGB19197.1 sulfate adenylyltransferase subunit 1 [Thermoanaerobacterium thermosaccharolyticum M0795]KAA5807157.1 sulfate adenylyltransferase [Thermoanaerobacterium thermosaccharolyticum]
MLKFRETLKIVVVGHVDHGKSTVIGRLLYDTKSLPEGAIEKVKRISKETGKPFEYAYLLDAFEEEQKQGITIDTTQIQFHTKKRDYVIIDAPGHVEFLKNMISGAANAEAALLVIDANEGVREQSKRHGYILSLLGIKKVYVLVNKMDLIDYSEEKFLDVKSDMDTFLKSINVFPQKYIPVSAFYGENIALRSKKMPWYKGDTVLDALDIFEKDKDIIDKPLRLPIQDVYKFDNRRIIAGRIESGVLNVGDEIVIYPSKRTSKIKTIEYWQEKDKTTKVEAGMSVGITLFDEFFYKRGEFITRKDDEAPLVGDTFKANIFWMGEKRLTMNKRYKLKLVTQETECEIAAINKVIDASTLFSNDNAKEVNTNEVAEVVIKTKDKICFDEFRNNHVTGRFVIVDGYDISGGGIINGLEILDVANKFVKENVELPITCFDEYYYLIPYNEIKKVAVERKSYKIGDKLPINGDTYYYPDNFDVIDLNNELSALIRDGKLVDLINLNDYKYEGYPVYSSDGFLARVKNQDDFINFKNDFKESKYDLVDFANKWYDPLANKRIVYKAV